MLSNDAWDRLMATPLFRVEGSGCSGRAVARIRVGEFCGTAFERLLTAQWAVHRLSTSNWRGSVRGNPKDSLLVKLRGRESVARQSFDCDSGPR